MVMRGDGGQSVIVWKSNEDNVSGGHGADDRGGAGACGLWRC